MTNINQKPLMHIAFGVDEPFVRGMGVCMVSILENNPSIDFIFHVFSFSIFDADREKLKELESKYGTKININIVDERVFSKFADFTELKVYSLATFTRLLIPDLLKDITDKVLYIDADIVCNGKLDELANLDLSNFVAAVVSDREVTLKRRSAEIDLKEHKYFNAGFLYINVKEWIKRDTWNLLYQDLLKNREKYTLMDQDALNVVIGTWVFYLEEKYNTQYDLSYTMEKGVRLNEQAIFIHFVGFMKPWCKWCLNPGNALFLKYNDVSPWKEVALTDPKRSREMRIYSKCLFMTGQKLEAFIAFLKYVKMKHFS